MSGLIGQVSIDSMEGCPNDIYGVSWNDGLILPRTGNYIRLDGTCGRLGACRDDALTRKEKFF